MTNLEKEIKAAIVKADSEYDFEENGFDAEAKAASEVAKRYIEKAIKDTYEQGYKCDIDPNECMRPEEFVGIWFKENGIE